LQTDSKNSSGATHRFEHHAMACDWELVIAGEEAEYAQQVAWAAWDEVVRVECQLSRFIASSDVFQINALAPGETIAVGLATLQCLRLAREIHDQTGGAFDVSIGALMDESQGRRKNEDSSQLLLFSEPEMLHENTSSAMGFHLLQISEEDSSVSVSAEGVRLDLGAVGKGYAIDQVAAVLRDWGVNNALVHSGQSTVMAMGAPDVPFQASASEEAPSEEVIGDESGWIVALRDPRNQERPLVSVRLRDRVLSGSGLLLHGRHIVDPRVGHSATPSMAKRLATWASLPLACNEREGDAECLPAARSDALSTGFMVLTDEEIDAFCRAHREVSALLIDDGPQTKITCFGEWNDVVSTVAIS